MDRLNKFEAALNMQTDIMVNNILGKGTDIHILGLREMAKELGIETPEIFSDESYEIFNHFKLSTSQVRQRIINNSFIFFVCIVPYLEILSKI